MNKQQAAEYLGVSTRAIERYTTKGRLTPSYEKGRTGPAPVYDKAQLDELKKEMDAAAAEPRAIVKRDKPAKPDKGDNGNALALRSGKTDLAAFVAAMNSARTPSIADLAHKLMLAEKEAARLSGLPLTQIREARKSGKLKAILTGGGWRVKRGDLDAYVRKF
jgi:excisionase family DNA binding protein